MEFNVLGSLASTGQGKWIAQGRYINDDGETLELAGNVNGYNLYASFDGTSTITVLIGMDMIALNQVVTPDGCVSVNKNDFMSSMSFHNAKGFALDGTFDVNVTLKPDNKVQSYSATYDAINDKLLFQLNDGQEICISRIVNIKITKKA